MLLKDTSLYCVSCIGESDAGFGEGHGMTGASDVL